MRMKTILNISKITKAMKMIAATKMRVEQKRMDK
jgi:F0F1-type ATP synthase gamma subunit